jgi:hypothetical protein
VTVCIHFRSILSSLFHACVHSSKDKMSWTYCSPVHGKDRPAQNSQKQVKESCICQPLLHLSASVASISLCCICQPLLHPSASVASVSLCCIRQSLLHLSASVASVSLCCICQISVASVSLCFIRQQLLNSSGIDSLISILGSLKIYKCGLRDWHTQSYLQTFSVPTIFF